VHGEHFSRVLFPGIDREVVQGDVEEFYTAVATSSEDLVFVGL
jgi:hypothetical protein